MKRLIAVAILLLVALATWGYDPPPDDELAGWWDGLTREERITQLRILDEIEHAVPILEEPKLVITQQRNGRIDAFFTDPLGINIGSLSYEVELPTATVRGNREVNVPILIGAGLTTGVALTILVYVLIGGG
jgi:hypothetical protein